MRGNIIEINNLTLPYVFTKFCIQFPKNKLLFIAGPANCGKTVLLKSLNYDIKTTNMIFFGNIGLENYKITELGKKIKLLDNSPFKYETVELEITNRLYLNNKTSLKEELIDEFKLNNLLKKDPNKLNNYDSLRLRLALAILANPKLLLLDNILIDLEKDEKSFILNILKKYKKSISIIMTTSNLEDALEGDYLYIINDSKIILEGTPLDVLKNDNILNKNGLELPFMVDLSVKLKDYSLLKDIILDQDRMVDILWK